MFELTGDLERVFREHIRVNVYASFHTTNALDVHWDDHDVLIFQVAGRKQWTVYGPTRPYPITNDIAANPVPDMTQKPIWEGMLEDGDFCYVPRGWWHRVDPVGEPSLHLSMGLYNRTGVELMEWVGRQLQASEVFRMDLPRFGGSEERAAHAEALREEILKALTPEMIDNYFAYLDGMAEPRPRLGLPWSVIQDVLPESDETRVRLAVLRRLRLRPTADGKSVSFSALGKRWKLPAATLPLLNALNDGERSIKELCEAAAGEISGEGVRALVKKLVTQGLVVSAEPAPEPAAFRAAL
jgi:ribosomal protein L16 Arg81 hydroxylase